VSQVFSIRHQLALMAYVFLAQCACAQSDTASSVKLLRLMDQARARVAAPASAANASSTSLPNPERMRERTQLLARGEAALAFMDTESALAAFETAANVLHAADTEMGIVRTYMQMGQYRRALAFGAHTAGSHLDVVGGAALYAWLLHAGGQRAVAQNLLVQARARVPNQALLSSVHEQLQSTSPLATGIMLQTPVRMAPFGSQAGLPKGAQVVGTGLLIEQGQRAIVPASVLAKASRQWLRNGLGQLSRAKVEKNLPELGLVVLKLSTPLPLEEPMVVAVNDGFAGSVAYAVDYVSSKDATPRWPILHSGFLGGPANPGSADDPSRLLGLNLGAGPRGGPVFDSAGHLAGIAVSQPGQADRIVVISRLRKHLGSALGRPSEAVTPRLRASVDQLYENSLRHTVQLVIAR
jgi:hypothetical protein